MAFPAVSQLPFEVKEAIKKRVSVRSFEEKALTVEDKNKLMDFNNGLTNPFDVNVRVQYISKNSGADNVKLGTYGTIKGAKDFLAVTVKDEPFAMEAVGYQFENDDLFPCICPIGYPSKKRSLLEKVTRVGLGSKKRKAWDQLFYLQDFTKPMTQADAGEYELALEMLRLAPSATNAQPWAVVKEGKYYHFFCHYKSSIGDDMKKIKHLDLGIALAHFHQTAMSDGLGGEFELKAINFPVPEQMHYVISYLSN